MSDYTDIEVTVDDPVCVIRLDRPEKLNAITYRMLHELRSAVEAAAADPAVVGIVITGNGRGFCAGLDTEALKATTAKGADARPSADEVDPDEVPGLVTWLLAVPKPVIAAVNGVAAGGGFVLAVMCDVRFASSAASFTTVFSKRGLASEHGTTWIVPRLVGVGRALDLLWTSRRFGADEAYRMGMVEYVVEPDRLLDEACDYVRRLAAEVSPASIADTKRMVYRHVAMGYPEALREADDIQWAAVARPDATEGVMSLLEKRPPSFTRLGG